MIEEIWKSIDEFPNYAVSNMGNIYNLRNDRIMHVSHTIWGHLKITLTSEWGGERFTRSVAKIVAEAFVVPPNELCTHIVLLDGNLDNVSAENIVWRPRWFAWKYSRQMKKKYSDWEIHRYRDFSVYNLVKNIKYDCIFDAGVKEGLLFNDIWTSTITHKQVFPTDSVFEIIERV